MAERSDDKELVSLKELLMSNSIQVDAITHLLIEKGAFTEDEFYDKLKQIAKEYKEKLKENTE